jgi:hypothetical protein
MSLSLRCPRSERSAAFQRPRHLAFTTRQLARVVKAKRHGPKRWYATCPVCRIARMTLLICESHDGRTLIQCKEGCPTAAVKACFLGELAAMLGCEVPQQ